MLATLVLLAATSGPPPDLTAVGIVLCERPERSVALVRSGGRTRVAGLGETAFGGRVVAIAPGVVTLEYEGGRRVDVRLLAEAATPAPAQPPAIPPAAGSGTVALPRADVERRLAAEVQRILAETAVAPFTEDGEVKGLALTRIPEGTLLGDAGLRPGDVLTRLNDVPVDSLATLVGLWSRLQGESELRAVVLRNGRLVTLTVTLK